MYQYWFLPFQILIDFRIQPSKVIYLLCKFFPSQVDISDIVVLKIIPYFWTRQIDDKCYLIEQHKLFILLYERLTLAVCSSPTNKPSNTLRPPADYIQNLYYKRPNFMTMYVLVSLYIIRVFRNYNFPKGLQ